MTDRCEVTHAPGGHYVCWTHRSFLPWSKPFNRIGGCCCWSEATAMFEAGVRTGKRLAAPPSPGDQTGATGTAVDQPEGDN